MPYENIMNASCEQQGNCKGKKTILKIEKRQLKFIKRIIRKEGL